MVGYIPEASDRLRRAAAGHRNPINAATLKPALKSSHSITAHYANALLSGCIATVQLIRFVMKPYQSAD